MLQSQAASRVAKSPSLEEVSDHHGQLLSSRARRSDAARVAMFSTRCESGSPLTDGLSRTADRRGPSDGATRERHHILVFASTGQRVMTMVPIATALKRAGYAVTFCLPPKIDDRASQTDIPKDLRCRVMSRAKIRRLEGIDVFIASDTAIDAGPPAAIRVAIYHSLPDYDLTYDYAGVFRRKPQNGAFADYFCIAVRQSPKDWTVSNYRRFIDRMFPPAMLKHRRKALTVVPLGYPKIDLLMKRAETAILRDTITYAPTQTTLKSSSVEQSGADIIAELLSRFPDHRIVFRPYPGPDIENLGHLVSRFEGDPRFVFDTSLTGDASMMRSAVVVTDQSSMAVSFALGLARPAVFFAVTGLAGSDPKGIAAFHPIGFRAGSVSAVGDAVARALQDSGQIAERIVAHRQDFIYNPGHAAEHLARIMPDIIADRTRREWLSIRRRPFTSEDPSAIAAHLEKMARAMRVDPDSKALALVRRSFGVPVPGPEGPRAGTRKSLPMRVIRKLGRLVSKGFGPSSPR